MKRRNREIISLKNWQGEFQEEVGFQMVWMASKDRVTAAVVFPVYRGALTEAQRQVGDRHKEQQGLRTGKGKGRKAQSG